MFFARVGRFFVRESRKIVHTGIQCDCETTALLKSKIAASAFDFGVVALVDAGEHLYCDLRIAFFFSQFF